MHLLPYPGRGDPARSMTSGEQRESVAIAVLFRSREGERVKRATLVKQALRLLPIYIERTNKLELFWL